MRKRKLFMLFTAWVLMGLMASLAQAGELTYNPINPNFGGNPLNGGLLLNSAQIQNDHEDPNRQPFPSFSDSFEDRVDRLVLNQIARGLLGSVFDSTTGELIPGTIDTGISTIVITDLGTELEIVITNNETGEMTTVRVPN